MFEFHYTGNTCSLKHLCLICLSASYKATSLAVIQRSTPEHWDSRPRCIVQNWWVFTGFLLSFMNSAIHQVDGFSDNDLNQVYTADPTTVINGTRVFKGQETTSERLQTRRNAEPQRTPSKNPITIHNDHTLLLLFYFTHIVITSLCMLLIIL